MVGALGCLTVAGSFVLSLMAMGEASGAGGVLTQPLFTWAKSLPFSLTFGLMADSLSLWWLLVVTGVGMLIHIYSLAYMAEDEGFLRFFAKLNYFIFAMTLLVLADNFVGLLVGWANVGFASFLLIGFWNQRPQAQAAARKAFLINVIGEVGMVVALALIIGEFGSLAFDAVFAAAPTASSAVLTSICLLLLLGVITKSAQLPLHTWLPDAMEGPTPVSALIHAATMVTAGVYLVIRAFPLFAASPGALQAVAIVGAASALFGALAATRQFDIKRVLAYSTMSQLGYMLMGAGVGAYAASAFHFFTHAFFKALLFLGAGMVTHALAGEQDIRKMGGLGKRLPFVSATFLIGVLAIAGAPGFAGFFSKDEILGALLAEGRTGMWLVGLITAGLTAYYMFRLFFLVFGGAPTEESQEVDAKAAGHGMMVVPVGLLALLSIGAGFIAIPGVTQIPTDYLAGVFARYGRETVHVATWGWPVFVTVIVAALGFVAAMRMFGSNGAGRVRARYSLGRPLTGPLVNAFYLDTLYMAAVGHVAQWWQGVSLRLQSGYVRRYALTFFAGFAAFVFYFLMV